MRGNAQITWASWGDRFEHQGYYGGAAHCLILVNGNTVICTEPWDNHGISVTNAAEDIATAVCRQHGIPLEQVVWIEHYIHQEGPKLEHRFDRVTFKDVSDEPHLGKRDGQQHLRHPQWKYMTSRDAEALFGRELNIHEEAHVAD